MREPVPKLSPNNHAHGHVPGSRTYRKHGATTAAGRIKLSGLAELDLRTNAAKAILAFKAELTSALGGDEHLSPQRRILIDLCARTFAILNHVDNYLFAQESLITKEQKLLHVLEGRMYASDSLVKTLKVLGLARVPTNVGDGDLNLELAKLVQRTR